MTEKEEIIKTIESMTGEHSAYSIFYDWVKMSSPAIANACSLFHNEFWKKREEDYLDIYKKYREKGIECFMKMFALLTICFENTILVEELILLLPQMFYTKEDISEREVENAHRKYMN